MQNKKFDQGLHDQYDAIGRDMSKRYFKRYNVDLVDNPDKYGVDLIAYKDDKKVGYVEVEVRNAWDGDRFLHETLNVPYRKRKLLELDMPVYLLSWSSTSDYGFLCKASVILKSEVLEKPNKYLDKSEHFFVVPVDKIRLVKA
jgi:hypothetical protein